MSRKKWSAEDLGAFLGENNWGEITEEPETAQGLQRSMQQLMPGTLCEQICPMLTHSRADIWEAGDQAGVMSLIMQLENPCLGVFIQNDTSGLWSSVWSIYDPEATSKQPDNNGAVFLVLKEPRAVAHFTGMHDVGLTGDNFANNAPIYELEEEMAETTDAESEAQPEAGPSRRGAETPEDLGSEVDDQDNYSEYDSEEEAEEYPTADAKYRRVKKQGKESDHAPGAVGVQYVLIICAPAKYEESLKAAMCSAGWFALKAFYNAVHRVGPSGRLLPVRFKDKETVKVVQVVGKQLINLLWADKVPNVTKIMTAAVSTFEWVGLFVEDNCEIISYNAAVDEWQIPDKEDPTFNEYVIGVACTLLGTCYTQKKNIGRQMLTRINALKAYCGKSKIDIDQVTLFTGKPEYEPGSLTGLISELIGQITCLVDATRTDCNAKITELMSIPKIRDHYALDTFSEGLLVQFRLVAQKVHSTTLRFAIASIRDYKQVSTDPHSKMSGQATALTKIEKEVNDRPYTGCCHPLPTKFQIAQYPHMCYYGVKVYEKSLTEKEKELFEDYKITSVESKLTPREMAYIQILVENTPAMDDSALADWIAKLDLATGLDEFNTKSDPKKLALIKVWKKKDPIPPIYAHLQSLDNAKARSKTNEALRGYLADATERLIADLWNYNTQNQHRYSTAVSDAVKRITAVTTEFVRNNLKDKSEIDARLSPEQMLHENEYIDSTLDEIKKVIDQVQAISNGIRPN